MKIMSQEEESKAASASKTKRNSYSIKFKIEAIQFASNNSIRKTANHFGIDESLVRRWKKSQEKLHQTPNKNRKTLQKHRPAKWLALEAHLKSWILDQRSAGRQISGTSVLHEARKSSVQMNLTNFKGSPKWVFNFMKRNNIVRRAVTSVGQHLPDDWEVKQASFVNFVNKNKEGLSLDQIGNMDEVPVTFDMPSNFTLEQKGTSDVKVVTCGSEKSRFTVVLCVTADGEKLPPYIIFKRKTLPKGTFPKSVVVSANEKATMNSAETQLWADKIWNKRKNSFFIRKSLLMIDAAPGHRTDDVKDKFKKTGTALAMIPGGLTKILQVLDISVNKSFKSHLRKEWEDWMISGVKDFTKSGNIKRVSYEEIAKWIAKSWERVPKSTIINGFKKTSINFYSDDGELEEDGEEVEEEGDDDEPDEPPEDADARSKLLDVFLNEDNFASDVEDEEEIEM